ncbi:MAG: enoyl-CoA hydratase, partial [Alphaproteobacteria bacterium]
QHEILSASTAMMRAIPEGPKPVIACVEGVATAAGCQLVSFCDLAVCSEEARFATPGVNIGLFCTTPLVGVGRKVARKHAMEMALTGDFISGADAYRMGLVNRVVPTETLREETEALAQKIASRSAQAIAIGKPTFYKQIDMPLDDALAFTLQRMIDGSQTDDAHEGSQAFFEKRDPEWK